MSLIFKDLSPEEYPQLLTAPYMPTNPGYVVFERYLLQALRLGPMIGLMVCPFPFMIHRGRLPFYDRSNLMFRGYASGGIVGGVAAGFAAGIVHGVYQIQTTYALTDHDVNVVFKGDRAAAEKEIEARLVNDALCLRRDPDYMMWLTTNSRLMFMSSLGVIGIYNKGSRLYRIALGAGVGLLISNFLSSTNLDTTFYNIAGQSAPTGRGPSG